MESIVETLFAFVPGSGEGIIAGGIGTMLLFGYALRPAGWGRYCQWRRERHNRCMLTTYRCVRCGSVRSGRARGRVACAI